MLLSLAFIFLCGMLFGGIFEKLRLPPLLGMLFIGILLGPYVFDWLDPMLLSISAELRQIALIIILTRAGLNLNVSDLKKVGRPAVLMCFLPASFEIAGMLLLAPKLLGVSLLDAAILGTVIAAVSPAVVVPKMLKLMDEGYGVKQGIPQLIMAGASVDDVFVIVLFTSFTGLASGGAISPFDFVRVPTSIFLGMAVGVLCGLLLSQLFRKIHLRDSLKSVLSICYTGGCDSRCNRIFWVAGCHEYGGYAAKRAQCGSRSLVGQVFQALGSGGIVAICPRRCNGGHPVCIGLGTCGGRSTFWSDGIPDVRRVCLPVGHKITDAGTPLLHVGIYAKSDSTGCHRFHSPLHGTLLRQYCVDSRCVGDLNYGAIRGFRH